MSTAPNVVLVIPCYNEARRIDLHAFKRALDAFPWLQLLFVDDGSTDETKALLERFSNAQPRARVLVLPTNKGKGEAVRLGLLEGANNSDICGFWDADLAAPLSELPQLLQVLTSTDGIEWVWGIRLRALGRTIERGYVRHYLGRLFATTSSLALGISAYDTQCGAKLFRSNDLLRAVISEPFTSSWLFDVEMLTRALDLRPNLMKSSMNTMIYEQPLQHWSHKDGSKVRATDFVAALLQLIAIKSRRAGTAVTINVNYAASIERPLSDEQ